jgi:hypothetical protein
MGRNMFIALCGFLALLLAVLDGVVPSRDCFEGGPPMCNNSIAGDPTCRGLRVTTADAWKRMDCDYVVYNIPAANHTNKWIVIHAGGCDTYTEDLGDFFAPDLQLNIFGLRPCGGFANSLCAAAHGYDICAALHTSWAMPAINPTYMPYGFGFNPPDLVDIYHTPGVTMLFLHEYGDTNSSYIWYPADGCNDTKPVYICVGGIDPYYRNKFNAIKAILENDLGNTIQMPCKLEVIDSNPYAQIQNASIPCTGILREYNNPSVVGGVPGAPNWAWEMPLFVTRAIMLATQVEPNGTFVNAFRAAINTALCTSFSDPTQMECLDEI